MPPQPAPPSLGLALTDDQKTFAQTYARNLAAQANLQLPTTGQAMMATPAGRPPISPVSPSVTVNNSVVAYGARGQFGGGEPALMVKFGHGKSSLSSGERAKLSGFVAKLAGNSAIVRVVGHASQRTGDMSYSRHLAKNFGVSLDRAENVARELRRLGVDPARLVVEAVGDSQPRYHETMPQGEAENRRVEVFLE